jgi:endonuclease YncB( thermonuclease family)
MIQRAFISLFLLGLAWIQFWSVWAEESAALVINEIAYRGTTASSADEWIELFNSSADQIDLTGWQLMVNSTSIHLQGVVLPYSYYLLERSDDQTISDRSADRIFTTSLSDAGAVLQLKNPSGQTVDQISSWHVDLADPPEGFSIRSSMERISPYLSGDLPINWRINNQQANHGIDASGNPIFGTPRYHNSQTIRAFGYGYEAIGILPAPITPLPEEVLISELEIIPPSGEKEWIEIWNATDQWFDLSSCKFRDSAADILIFEASDSLLPGEMNTIELSAAKLGDNGDIVELVCSEISIDQVEYGSQSTGTSYVSSEGYDEEFHYLPSPNGFNTLGRSPSGNSLWFLFSHEDYPTKGQPNPDLRPVSGVSGTTFVVGGNTVRLHWVNPEDESFSGTKVYLQHSGTSHQFALYESFLRPENSALISALPNEVIEFKIVSFNDSGKEAEGLNIAQLTVNLLGIEISEVLPYPQSGLEFIEFHNASFSPIDLTGFELSIANASADLNDPSGSFEFVNFILSPGEYFPFFIDPNIHSFRLSNTSSFITLSDPDGIGVSEVDYLLPHKGVSIAFDGELQTTLFHPTPGSVNIFQNDTPQAILTVQGTGSIQGCTVLNFNTTAENSSDPDGDELTYSWSYRVQGGTILFTSSDENPLSFKFTEEIGEFFEAKLIVFDPFGASDTVTIPLELQFCNGRKRTTTGSSSLSSIDYGPSTIYINEIFPNPSGSDTGVEFIELFNSGANPILLDGWKIGGKTKKNLKGETIRPQQYFVFKEATLLNSANTIQLLAPDSSVISQVNYPDPEEGESYSRDEKGQFHWTIPTPGKINDFPFIKETVYLQGTAPVIIHRILPNPKGEDDGREWIELKNRSDKEMNLNGWLLDNREGGSKPFTISGILLSPQQVQRFVSSKTGIELRNTADQVRLFDPEGKQVDQLEWKTEVGSDIILLRDDLANAKEIKPDTAEVVKVVDGDTIDVRITTKTERVRLIGVDTPETVHPFKPLELFGKEASDFTKTQLQGKTIRLEYDLSKRDKYGRILAYVYLEDRHFNAELIEKGYAFAYLRFPFKYREEFRQLEMRAKQAGVGMWKSSEIQEIQHQQQEVVDEELEGMAILEEILEELEPEEKPEEELLEEKIEYDQTGWEHIKLNEILPNPKGKDEGLEYIELMSLSDTKVDLLNWKILNNKKKELYAFVGKGHDLSLQFNERNILLLKTLKTNIKNESETIQLVDPLGTVRDEWSYGQPIKDDQVWSRNPHTQRWQLLRDGTPGKVNKAILLAEIDRDRDGISDDEEILLGLDPDSWDSDGDGYPDDFELLMKNTEVENLLAEYQKYLNESFKIEMKQTARTLTFLGESRPYTKIHLTIYSEPQTVIVPVGNDGSWTYKVDLGLEKGQHRVEAFAADPVGQKSEMTPPIHFVLEARVNVSKLAKTTKKKTAKVPQVKPLYQIVEPVIQFHDGEIASWDADTGVLTLNDGKKIQLHASKKELGNVFLRIGEHIRYSLEHDQITIRNLQIIPSASAHENQQRNSENEPWFLLTLFFTSLTICFIVGRKRSFNEKI